MDKRSTAVIAILLTTLVCGLPGIVILCAGMLGVLGVYLPDTDLTFTGNAERIGTLAVLVGIGCLGIAGILIPILVAIFTLRKPPPKPLTPEDLNQPIPPPS
jgi:hypothetical protein